MIWSLPDIPAPVTLGRLCPNSLWTCGFSLLQKKIFLLLKLRWIAHSSVKVKSTHFGIALKTSRNLACAFCLFCRSLWPKLFADVHGNALKPRSVLICLCIDASGIPGSEDYYWSNFFGELNRDAATLAHFSWHLDGWPNLGQSLTLYIEKAFLSTITWSSWGRVALLNLVWKSSLSMWIVFPMLCLSCTHVRITVLSVLWFDWSSNFYSQNRKEKYLL